MCPYHGWAFDAEGKLRDVPSAEHGSWPKRPLVGSYDTEERGGFVWLFYGNKSMPADERPPIPFTPELEDPQWRAGGLRCCIAFVWRLRTLHAALFQNDRAMGCEQCGRKLSGFAVD